MDRYKTEQEKFWAGEFGSNYIGRNSDAKLMESNLNIFSKILKSTNNINSVIEFGANIGMNLLALKKLLPNAEFTGIEINKEAAKELSKIERVDSINTTIFDFNTIDKWDFSFTKGVLIHIEPDYLSNVYLKLYESSKKWICIAEYYNPVPVKIDYRGHSDCLFKRDFAGDMLNQFKDLELVDYGFAYHRDPLFPQDDITWFLMKKN